MSKLTRKQRREQERQKAKATKRPRAVQKYLRQALTHQQGRRFEKATALYERALQMIPDDAEIWNQLGSCLLNLDRLEAATAALTRCIELQPKHAIAHANLGNAAARSGDLTGALAHYKHAKRLAPRFSKPHYNAAKCHAMLQQWHLAVDGYRAALAIKPDYRIALANLAVSLSMIDKPKEALIMARKALELDPLDLVARRALARAQVQLGDRAAADETYAEILQISNSPELVHMREAMAGRTTDAPPAGYARDVFDRFAVSFDHVLDDLEYRGPQLLAAALEKILPPPNADLFVYDLGCGTGRCGHYMKRYARRMVGVDLSSGMLARAEEKGGYDELRCADGLIDLQGVADCDVVISADVLIYVGRVEPLFAAISKSLRTGGLFAFTIESLDYGDVRLEISGRYSHNYDYVASVGAAVGMVPVARSRATLRRELGRPVACDVLVLRREP